MAVVPVGGRARSGTAPPPPHQHGRRPREEHAPAEHTGDRPRTETARGGQRSEQLEGARVVAGVRIGVVRLHVACFQRGLRLADSRGGCFRAVALADLEVDGVGLPGAAVLNGQV